MAFSWSWAGWGRGGAGRRSPRRRGRGIAVCDFCDDYNYGIKQVAGNDDFEYGIKQAGNDDYNYDKGRYLFFRLVAQGRRTSSYRRQPGFSPSMQPMVFWPHAGAG